MNTTYREVEISYDERDNTWTAPDFKSKESLALMKAAIDRHLDKPDSPVSRKMKALHEQYGRIEIVTITSLGEDGSLRYTNSKGERAKAREYSRSNFKQFDQELLDEWNALDAQAKALKERMEVVTDRLVKIDFNATLSVS